MLRVAEKRKGNRIVSKANHQDLSLEELGRVSKADCLLWGQARLGRVSEENCSGLTPAVAGVACPV